MNHTATIQTVLQNWGFGSEIIGIPLRTITNDALRGAGTHDDKYIVELQGVDGRIFIGAANRDWPAAERVEERLSAVGRAACVFPDGVSGHGDNAYTVQLVAALRRPHGRFMYVDDDARRYVTPAHDGTPLKEPSRADRKASYSTLAFALGAYHKMMAAAGRPLVDERMHSHDLDRDVPAYVRTFSSAWEREETRDGFDASLVDKMRNVSRFLTTRGARLGALPRTWIHDDFQLKNVMELPRRRLAIIDMPDGSWAPRLLDLAFVLGKYLTFDDGDGDTSLHLRSLLDAYHHGGGTVLTDEEASLLPNVLQLKFVAEAHFWYHNSPDAAEFKDRAQRAALNGSLREAIRAAARHTTGHKNLESPED